MSLRNIYSCNLKLVKSMAVNIKSYYINVSVAQRSGSRVRCVWSDTLVRCEEWRVPQDTSYCHCTYITEFSSGMCTVRRLEFYDSIPWENFHISRSRLITFFHRYCPLSSCMFLNFIDFHRHFFLCIPLSSVRYTYLVIQRIFMKQQLSSLFSIEGFTTQLLFRQIENE